LGTTSYFAPEVVVGKECGKAVDLWTLGILAYELSNYASPFQIPLILSYEAFKTVVSADPSSRKWAREGLSEELKDFINDLLKFKPEERLGGNNSWEKVKNHTFFKSVQFDWQSLE
jgi:serine/threonine protein kinase